MIVPFLDHPKSGMAELDRGLISRQTKSIFIERQPALREAVGLLPALALHVQPCRRPSRWYELRAADTVRAVHHPRVV